MLFHHSSIMPPARQYEKSASTRAQKTANCRERERERNGKRSNLPYRPKSAKDRPPRYFSLAQAHAWILTDIWRILTEPTSPKRDDVIANCRLSIRFRMEVKSRYSATIRYSPLSPIPNQSSRIRPSPPSFKPDREPSNNKRGHSQGHNRNRQSLLGRRWYIQAG